MNVTLHKNFCHILVLRGINRVRLVTKTEATLPDCMTQTRPVVLDAVGDWDNKMNDLRSNININLMLHRK